jgi:hypothetical protein
LFVSAPISFGQEITLVNHFAPHLEIHTFLVSVAAAGEAVVAAAGFFAARGAGKGRGEGCSAGLDIWDSSVKYVVVMMVVRMHTKERGDAL